MTEIANKTFSIAIGKVILRISSDMNSDIMLESTSYSNSSAELFTTDSHKIELFQFTLPNDQHLTNSCDWLIRIRKITSIPEVLRIEVQLTESDEKLEFDYASGEHLDAISATSQRYLLHIGTEDGEILNSRAENNDWFPEGLKNVVNFERSITTYRKDLTGLESQIPIMKEGDKLSLHYLVAIEQKSEDQNRIDSWLAVDMFKRNIENYLGIW
ncbi:MAG: hypothetical protein QNK23_09215 [Crocinitomicaceae bacterium]|nr:hypothetical protein [Crocinitomicaceae bacterium]